MMPRFFLPGYFLEPVHDFFVRAPIPQSRTQIMFGDAKEAGANLAIRSQPDAIAMPAKRFANRRDDSDFPAPVRERPALGGRGRIFCRRCFEIEALLKTC